LVVRIGQRGPQSREIAACRRSARRLLCLPDSMSTLPLALLVAQAATLNAPATSVEAGVTGAPERELDTVNGLYPLWEQTAVLHPKGTVELGYQHAQVSLGPVQVGSSPYLDLYGTYNLELKLKLFAGPATAVALVAAGYRVPTQAESRTIGNLHAVGLANPYDPVWVFPLSLAASRVLSPRLHLHATATVLTTHAGAAQGTQVSFGQVAVLEMRATSAWRAFVHAGLEGLGVEPNGHLGLSFGYRGRHVLASAGYARRMSFDGESAHVFLLDGGLVFP
jgi:hypothetical protein